MLLVKVRALKAVLHFHQFLTSRIVTIPTLYTLLFASLISDFG